MRWLALRSGIENRLGTFSALSSQTPPIEWAAFCILFDPRSLLNVPFANDADQRLGRRYAFAKRLPRLIFFR